MIIKRGTMFDTPYEHGCIALNAPNKDGAFDAIDEEGVICSFNVKMVKEVFAQLITDGET